MSKPFAADHGKPSLRTLSCKLRAVMSTAKATEGLGSLGSEASATYYNRRCGYQHWLVKCFGHLCQSPRQARLLGDIIFIFFVGLRRKCVTHLRGGRLCLQGSRACRRKVSNSRWVSERRRVLWARGGLALWRGRRSFGLPPLSNR